MLEALRSLTAHLTTARNATDIGGALYSAAGHFGFTTGLGLDLSKLFGDLDDAILFAGQREAVAVLNTVRPLSEHPLVNFSRATDLPFLMGSAKAALGLNDEQWWAVFPPYFRGFDGVVVPVHDRGTLIWYVAFAGLRPDLSPASVAMMSCATHAGYARFRELMDSTAPHSPLTPRESECLMLVAQGKTDEEIAAALEISTRTVRFHVGNAKSKLGVSTRVQAVAKQLGVA